MIVLAVALSEAAPAPAVPPALDADFSPGVNELRARIGFNGFRPGPFSILAAFVGWNEFGVSYDRSLVVPFPEFTFGIGAEAWYAQPLVLQLTSRGVSDTEIADFAWSMHDRGLAARGTFHWTALSSVDPYFFGLVGVSATSLKVREAGETEVVRWDTPTLRLGGGAGITVPLSPRPEGRWVVGAEFRYLGGIALTRRPVLEVPLAAGGVAPFVPDAIHRPPIGFSWVISGGWRF